MTVIVPKLSSLRWRRKFAISSFFVDERTRAIVMCGLNLRSSLRKPIPERSFSDCSKIRSTWLQPSSIPTHITFGWLKLGKAPAPLISTWNDRKAICSREVLTSPNRALETFPKNFRVKWIFSGSTGLMSPPRAFRLERTDRTRGRTCGSSRSMETKLRIGVSDNSIIRKSSLVPNI